MKHNFRTLYVSTGRNLQSSALRNYRRVMVSLCRAHDCDYAREIRGLVETSDYPALLAVADRLSSQQHEDARMHYLANQFSLLIRKYPFPQKLSKTDPEGVAVKKFLTAEHRCKRINLRFRLRESVFKEGRPSKFEREIHSMRASIRYIIGDVPDVEAILQAGDFGPGAAIGVHGKATNVGRKVLSRWSVTPGAYNYGRAAVMLNSALREELYPKHAGFTDGVRGSQNLLYQERVTVVRHNNISFVPKTCKTHRSIAVEPLLNSYIQKGVDSLMRLRLKRIGIDLSDQSLNQRLAREGSVDDSDDGFVTIDLASASDSVATEVVRTVLPPEWFALLNAIRSKEFELRGKRYVYHKFCSMGNGFCFPLETLMFTSACIAVGAGRPGIDFSVYGDDIIVRKRFAAQLIDLLDYLGFRVNADKTFLEGPFRESCGADWFGGVDVRPFTLDFALDSIENVFKFLNLTRRSSITSDFFDVVKDVVLSLLPEALKLWRPFKGEADSGIDCYADEHLRSRNCVYDTNLYAWSCLQLQHEALLDPVMSLRRVQDEHPGALVYAALRGSASARPFTIRRETKTKVRFAAYSGATCTWLPAAGG